MSALGGTRGERNAKPKFAALDINKLYITSRGESLEPSTQKNSVPRKHGMQSLGKVPTARRAPANLPSLKAEVSNPLEQSGTWTNDQNEGQNVGSNPTHITTKAGASANSSISSGNSQHQSGPNNSNNSGSTWNTSEFPSLDGTGSHGLKAQPGISSQMALRPQTGAASWTQPHASEDRESMERELDCGANDLNGPGSYQISSSAPRKSPLPPQFRALLPPFMQRKSDSGSVGNGNEGNVFSSSLGSLPAQPVQPHTLAARTSSTDPKINVTALSGIGTNPNQAITGNNKKGNSSGINISGSNTPDGASTTGTTAASIIGGINNNNSKGSSSSSSSSSSSGNSKNNNIGNGDNNGNNSKGQKHSNNSSINSNNKMNYNGGNGNASSVKRQTDISQNQSQGSVISSHQQQQVNRIEGGRARVVGKAGVGASGNVAGVGGIERGSGAAKNDHYQYPPRRGGNSQQPPRYANRGAMGGGAGNYNTAAGHARGGNSAGSSSDVGGSPAAGFNEDNRGSVAPYGSSMLTEQEVVVRPIIRDEELQRLEVIAKDEGWAKDYEFDYNQQLEFSDDESEQNSMSVTNDNVHPAESTEKKITGIDAEKVGEEECIKNHEHNRGMDENRNQNQDKVRASTQSNGFSARTVSISDSGPVNANIAVGGALDATEAKERLMQRHEEDQRREMERKQAAARKLQELEQKLSRKKTNELIDNSPSNNDINVSGNSSNTSMPTTILTSSSSKLEEERKKDNVTELSGERSISVRIRGKSGDRNDVKEMRYEYPTGALRYDREVGEGSSGSGGMNWDMPGFSKTFQSNLPPRFQKRKFERNTSGTNLSANSGNVSNNQSSRMSSGGSTGNMGLSSSNAVGEAKNGIPFAQQYDPRFIHNQQIYGKSGSGTIGSRSGAAATNIESSSSMRSIRERDERQRQQFDHRDNKPRELVKSRSDCTDESERSNNTPGGLEESSAISTQNSGGGSITPQLDRSLSETFNRNTSVSSDDTHPHGGQNPVSVHSSYSRKTGSGFYGREMSWDLEADKNSPSSSPASFSDRQWESSARMDYDQPKHILQRSKEMSPATSAATCEDVDVSSIDEFKSVDYESATQRDRVEKDEHLLTSNAVATAGDAGDTKTSVDSDNQLTENVLEQRNQGFQTEEFPSAAKAFADSLVDCSEDGQKDAERMDSSQKSRSEGSADVSGNVFDKDAEDKQQTSMLLQLQHQQPNAKKKSVAPVAQQQSRDNRRQDPRAGARGGSYSGAYHRNEGAAGGSNSRSSGGNNWSRSRGGGRGGRSYNHDCWSESEFSEESFDEQSKQHLHHYQMSYLSSGTSGGQTTGAPGVGSSKEGFVPRGEPSRRGRGGGYVGGPVATSAGSANIRQKQIHSSALGRGSPGEGSGSICSKIEGYGPPNSKSPFGGGASNSDDRNAKHGTVGDGGGSAIESTFEDNRTARPFSSGVDSSKVLEDVLQTRIDQGKGFAMIADRKLNVMNIHDNESHSNEDIIASHKLKSKTDDKKTIDTGNEGTASKSIQSNDDGKTRTKGITSTMNVENVGSPTTLQQQTKHAKSSPVSLDGAVPYRGPGAPANVGDKVSSANYRGNSNNHLATRMAKPPVARGQGVRQSNVDSISDDAMSQGSNFNPTILKLPNVSNSGAMSMTVPCSATSALSTEDGRACEEHHQPPRVDKLAIASSSVSAKTDNTKHHLDGNTPPVNTIIFENTNYKSGVSVNILGGGTASTGGAGDCGGVGSNPAMRRQQISGNAGSVTSKIGSSSTNDKLVGGSAGPGGAMKAQQLLSSGSSTHRSMVPATTGDSSLQSVVGSSQRIIGSSSIPKQQQTNVIGSALHGIAFQKKESSENDEDVKAFVFDTEISHLIDSDKSNKQQSSISAGLCLTKAIDVAGGEVHNGASGSSQNMFSPSTAELNMKIASVKKVWEMPSVPEQTELAGGSNIGGAKDHLVSGGENVASASNMHLKSNFAMGPHHQSHLSHYQHPNHQKNPASGGRANYGPGFGAEPESLVDNFSNHPNSVCGMTNSPLSGDGWEQKQQQAQMHQQQLQHHQQEVSHQRQSQLLQESQQQQPKLQPHQQQSQAQLQQLQQPEHGQHLQQQQSHQNPHHAQQQQHQKQRHEPDQEQQQEKLHKKQQQKQSPQQPSQQASQQQQQPQQQSSQQQPQHQHSQESHQHQQQQHQHEQQLQQHQHQQQQDQEQQPPHLQQHRQQEQAQHLKQQRIQEHEQAHLQRQHQSQQEQSQHLQQPVQKQSQSHLATQNQTQLQLQPQLKSLHQQQHPQSSQQLSQLQQHSQQHSQQQSQLHSQQHSSQKQPQHQQQIQQHSVQKHQQQSHHQQPLQVQHQQQAQQQAQQHASAVQQHQAAVAVSMGLNKHPAADILAAVAANNINVCKVKPTQQGSGGLHQSNNLGLSPPPQMQSGSLQSAPQPFYPAQYGVSAIPSPPAVLYNSPAAMTSQGGLYNAFQIEPSGRSQFSQFPGHYGTSGTAGPYNTYMAATPTNMQAGPTPEMFQSLSSQFRMGSVQSPYNQSTQLGNPNTMLISSSNSSLMSSSVKSSAQQIGAIGQPKPSGGSVGQPPYGQQYLNMFPPGPLQNTAASYYSNSAGGQNAFFGTANAAGAGAQNAYGIPTPAVAAASMYGGHSGQNPSNAPQAPTPQQQMPSYNSQFLNSPLLNANNPSMGQQQYRGGPSNSSQQPNANASAYIKSNQSPQSSHIQQQQQQQQQDTWDLQNQLIQHQQQQIPGQQQQSIPSQQQPLLSTGSGGQQSQGNQKSPNHGRTMASSSQAHAQLIGCVGSNAGGGGGAGSSGSNTSRNGPPLGQGGGLSGTQRYPSPIQRPSNFLQSQVPGMHHQQRANRPVGHGQQAMGSGGCQQPGLPSSAGQVNNSNKHYYGGNRG